MNKIKIEFLYDKHKDMTTIYVWSNHTPSASIIDKHEMPGILTSYTKKKIRNELIKKYEEEE